MQDHGKILTRSYNPCEMAFGIPRIFLGIPRNKGVNFHGKFGLGIPNHNNSGSKNLEIPRNSQKFPEIPSL